ncbi:MAG: threonine dehydratase [Rhodospirillaceae bacterium]|nr:threonine dehydratase [Rhodospirillaceae bacterium]
MNLPDLAAIEAATETVRAAMPPTPAHCWPLLCARTGAEVWVKHENHTPIGAFKLRGGLVYMDRLRRAEPAVEGVIAATRGNHGQAIATAARRNGLTPVIVVPEGNSREKNAAMQAQGAELVVHGSDFQEALEHAEALAGERGLHMVASFAAPLVHGTATYALEFFRAAPDLDAVYVPIGLGSGICGAIAARDALGLATEIVGVCAENAACYALSFAAGKPVPTNSADTMADGMACRVPAPDAVAVVNRGAARIVTVSEAEIEAAIRAYYPATPPLAEGAGAAALAALVKEREAMAGRRAGLVLSGGNIDREVYLRVLAGGDA